MSALTAILVAASAAASFVALDLPAAAAAAGGTVSSGVQPPSHCSAPPKDYSVWDVSAVVAHDDVVQRDDFAPDGSIPSTQSGATVGAVWGVEVLSRGPLQNDTWGAGPVQLSIQHMAVVKGPLHATDFSWSADGSFTWHPVLGYLGGDSFTYRISDNNGFCKGLATVTIPPSGWYGLDALSDDTYTTYSDTTFSPDGGLAVCDLHHAPTGGFWQACGLLRNDAASDVSGYCSVGSNGELCTFPRGPVAFAGVGTFQTAHGSVTLHSDGEFAYTPDPGFAGDDQFGYATGAVSATCFSRGTPCFTSYGATNLFSGFNGSFQQFANVSIHVVPRPPGAVDQAPVQVSVNENTPLAISNRPGSPDGSQIMSLNGSQEDAIRTDHGTLHVTWNTGIFTQTGVLDCSLLPPSQQPTCVKTTAASISYTPDTEFYGGDHFGYRTLNGLLSGTQTIDYPAFINVNEVKALPANTPGCFVVSVPNHSTTPVDITNSFTDPDRVALTVAATVQQSFPIGTNPPTGILFNSFGNWKFTATATGTSSALGFLLSIPYVYPDKTFGSFNSCVEFVVTAHPAVDDAYSVDENQVLQVAAPGALANDDPPPVGGPAALQTPPDNGTVILNSDGSFRYTPDQNFYGTDSFTYVNNGSPATVTITVNHVLQVPVVTLNSPGCNPLIICINPDTDNRLNLAPGDNARLRGFITDPEASHGSFTVDWGDGTTTTASYPCTGQSGCPFQTTPTFNFACGASPCPGIPLYFEFDHVYSAPPATGSTFNITTNANADDGLSGQRTSTATMLLPGAITGFSPPASGLVGDTVALSATGGGSSSPVVFGVDALTTTGVCSLSGATLQLTGAGTCIVNANQASDATHAAAPQVQASIVVAKRPQTITFSPPATAISGGTATLAATSGSGGAVSFEIDPATRANICSIAGGKV
ncbi:MAG: outer rane adhesin like protein [Actinomycetia bacterium]|nr:outer rane adhesin like protein [Actinomycetes bacterium]